MKDSDWGVLKLPLLLAKLKLHPILLELGGALPALTGVVLDLSGDAVLALAVAALGRAKAYSTSCGTKATIFNTF